MGNRKSVTINLEVGQEILVGRFRNSKAKITKIEVEKDGSIVLGTTQGTRKALTFRLIPEDFDSGRSSSNPADKYR